jgi:glycosyltransferase involved in cell wall biosynthesis
MLGHTEVLLRLLETRDREHVLPRIYSLFGSNDELLARAAALGVPVESHAGAGGPHDWLRSRMAANGESTAVWVSAPPTALFVFGARVAPVQVFWSLKHHAVRSADIDGYLTYGSWGERERTFHGQRWTVCPVPLALDPRPRPEAEVRALRARFPQRLLFGTLAREEKIDSRPFLEAVAQILERHPDAGWVWTGRARHGGIDAFFRARGLGDRCHFVGWVDTPLYAAILDVFLETFPLGCGITGYQALGAGVPLVSYLEDNTVFGMQYMSEVGGKGGAVARETLDQYRVLVARDPAEYVELASRLASDPAFRATWIERERQFYEEEILGIGRYARRFFEAIAAVQPQGRP